MKRPLKQKTIGLIGGCSNVATGEYYRFLNDEVNARLGGWEIAETLISGMNFGNIEAFVRAGAWDQLEAYMERHVDRLIAGGADAILCVSNTLHKSLGKIMSGRDTSFIHIADPTGEAIRNRGLEKIILLGTEPVMKQPYLKAHYEEKFGLEIIVPDPDEQRDVDRIIFEELVKFDIRETSRQRYLDIVDRLVREQHADGVILGCTEIFLLLREEDRPELPMFNTTRLHCQAAVDFALS
nr:amino acid racemase [uncultured Cohaesibacter sp.]